MGFFLGGSILMSIAELVETGVWTISGRTRVKDGIACQGPDFVVLS